MNKDVIFTCIHIYKFTFCRVPNAFAPTHTKAVFLFLFVFFSLSKSNKTGCSIMTPHGVATSLPIAREKKFALLPPHKKKSEGRRSHCYYYSRRIRREHEYEESILNTDRLG